MKQQQLITNIDNVQIFNVALSAAQIKFLYDNPYFMKQQQQLITNFVNITGKQPLTTYDYTTEEGLCGACLLVHPERHDGIVCSTCKALDLVIMKMCNQ